MRNDAANQSAPRGIDLENKTKRISSSVRFWHVAYSTHFKKSPKLSLRRHLWTRGQLMVSKKANSLLVHGCRPYKRYVVLKFTRQTTLLSSRETSGRCVLTSVLSLVQAAVRTRARQFWHKDNRYSGYQIVRSGLREIGGGYPTDNRSLNL